MSEDEAVRVRIPVRVDFAGGWTDVHYFSSQEGGEVLNAAILPCVEGEADWRGTQLDLRYSLDLPPGTGLGTSASVDVAWLAMTYRLMGREFTAAELAEDAYRLEKLLGVEGGKQDQYAAALGGFNYLRFGAEDEPADVEQLDIPLGVRAELEGRLLLAYTGQAHASGDLHERVWDAYRSGDREKHEVLCRMRELVPFARRALLDAQFEELARIMIETYELSLRLERELVTPEMDALAEAAHHAGAIGWKACGAGGGGCMLFLCQEGALPRLVERFEKMGVQVIPVRFQPGSER